jgi:polysaccharide pyruvyl transferase WcaK-like protein
MKINLIGWYGKGNIGDDSFQSVFSGAFAGHELVFSQRPDLSADAFILGGGGVIDYGYFDGLEKIGEKPLYAVGVDIPLSGPKYDDLILKFPFRKILVRSKEYCWLARSQGLTNVFFMPDLAFWMDPPKKAKSNFPPKLGVSLMNHLLENEDHLQEHIMRVLEMRKDTFDISFLVFKDSDEDMISKVLSKGSVPCQVLKPKTPEEMLNIISDLNVLLTMRFHGAVFANICKIPFISLSNPGKHSIFCEQENIHDSFLDIRDLNPYKLMTALERMLAASARDSFPRGKPDVNRELVKAELSMIRQEIESLILR